MNRLNKYQLNKKIFFIIISFLIMSAVDFSQQININQIEKMPNMPSPYLMRNWKEVALGYDSLVFDLHAQGQYLPLVWTDNSAQNYSGSRFGLHTVVGTTVPFSAEAINCIPAVVGASLVGINKSNQNGYNWVSMCQEWFNKINGQNVYKNQPNDMTSDDWWYETMPNVFFYQLFSLYPNVGDFHNQFISVADQWLKAVYAMGGSTTPWQLPNMDHRGWDILNMVSNDVIPHEPEAAGAIAWLLYNAYVKTGLDKYRIGAELVMEFLNNWNSNPAYEIQLPYGVYTAARMNAELGTNYNIVKMINWCFNITSLRSWGVMSNASYPNYATWGVLDCDGLVGEINYSNNYAFVMNGFEQVGALVPLVRYDTRFARAIGKWVLNVANASRLFYPKYLPAANQETVSKSWADQYDPNSYIAHESMHQYSPNNFLISPYSMGDAVSGNWGLTNLSLYSSSHVGILAGIIDTTNVEGILQLDVLKTDYFHNAAYPTFLYFNSYTSDKSVTINVGNNPVDIYDAVSKTFMKTGVVGQTYISIPANTAVLAILAPAGGTKSYDLKKFLINGVVVDYNSNNNVPNYPPRIKSLSPNTSTLITGDTVKIYCTAVDPDGDSISYSWKSSSGTIIGRGLQVSWASPKFTGNYIITCIVKDNLGLQDSVSDTLTAVNSIYHLPVINNITALPRKINIDSTSILKCFASDSSNYSLSYSWFSSYGNITGNGSSVIWTAPHTVGNYYIGCSVNDSHGGIVTDSLEVEVRDLSAMLTDSLMAYYPFDGNANDETANHNNGTVYGAILTSDRFGNPNSAYKFDGKTNYILVPSSSSLNFQNAITINFWMTTGSFNGSEQYVISQGSYDNRLKISIIPSNNLRWTIKTTSLSNGGIIDLDSQTKLVKDSLYNVTVLYSGSDIEIYLNGNLDSFSSWSGSLLQTKIGLTFAQMLPTDQNYNFNGTLDDIRIFNYALSPQQILNLYNFNTTGILLQTNFVPQENSLMQNYPNPFNPSTKIYFTLNHGSKISLNIYNTLGQRVAVLADGYYIAGSHSINWEADRFSSGVYYYELKIDSQRFIKKMILLK
ncbi:MAG: LamG-like jellyroll fold domain-containing protein [Ignavibacteriaceae bacterium]